MSVYFLQATESRLVKIGASKDIGTRVYHLQSKMKERLHLLGWMDGDRKLEQHLHRRFANLRDHGEWFKPHSTIFAYVSEHTTNREPPVRWIDCHTYLEAALAAKLRALAKEESRSMSSQIRWMIKQVVPA